MPEKPEKTTNPDRILNIHINRDAALVVGNEAPVTVQLGAKNRPALSVDELDHIGEMISSIAAARGVDEIEVKMDLARQLDAGDLPFLSQENLGDAIKILSKWRDQSLHGVIGEGIRTRRQ